MLVTASFVTKHAGYCVKNPRTAYATIKAMRQYAKDHPVCEWDRKSIIIEVHHVKPIEKFPELAADPTNFISLGARTTHRIIGHGGNWKNYVENVRELCHNRVIERNQKDVDINK